MSFNFVGCGTIRSSCYECYERRPHSSVWRQGLLCRRLCFNSMQKPSYYIYYTLLRSFHEKQCSQSTYVGLICSRINKRKLKKLITNAMTSYWFLSQVLCVRNMGWLSHQSWSLISLTDFNNQWPRTCSSILLHSDTTDDNFDNLISWARHEL